MRQLKMNWAILGGHIIECFDATIYGFFAVMLAPIFFPGKTHLDQVLLSYGLFAAGFVARPLGALVMGYLGDRIGRRLPLLVSMAFVGVPTFLIGALPGYEVLGVWAPLILLICRLAQGFFYSAESAGVSIYLYESYHRTRRLGSHSGVLVGSGVWGAALASAIGAFCTMETMPTWAWRVPFLVGGVCAFGIYLWRRRLIETPDFQKLLETNSVLAVPFKSLWAYKWSLLLGLGAAAVYVMPLYLVTIYGNYLFRELGYSSSQSMLLNVGTLIFDGCAIAFFGWYADKNGFQRQITWGLWALFLVALPSFYCVSFLQSIWGVYLFIFPIKLADAFVVASIMPYISSFFPTQCRYSAVALSTSLGVIIAGFTPAVALFLTDFCGTKMAPAFWMMGFAALVLLGIEIRKRYLASQPPQEGEESNLKNPNWGAAA